MTPKKFQPAVGATAKTILVPTKLKPVVPVGSGFCTTLLTEIKHCCGLIGKGTGAEPVSYTHLTLPTKA